MKDLLEGIGGCFDWGISVASVEGCCVDMVTGIVVASVFGLVLHS